MCVCVFSNAQLWSDSNVYSGNDDIVTKPRDTQQPGEGSAILPEGAISMQEQPR